MSPHFASNNDTHHSLRNIEYVTNALLRIFTRCPQATYLSNLISSEFGFILPILLSALSHVFGLRTKPKVIDITATSIITLVKNVQPLFDIAVIYHPRKYVRTINAPLISDTSIPFVVGIACPFPAIIFPSSDDMTPETRDRFSVLLLWSGAQCRFLFGCQFVIRIGTYFAICTKTMPIAFRAVELRRWLDGMTTWTKSCLHSAFTSHCLPDGCRHVAVKTTPSGATLADLSIIPQGAN